ncbi:hypothetical protein Nepgr_029994 [Nepenthes gracilis]|uniref:LysM domain-containing protein n=1 Tax=Nepenthes gracilis TaxID=150966 RepID=A0AAD3TFD7_NEPGR|nr:hypothetical protein Nepgr_029994 [Nepenthes gracilis]
MAAAVPGPPPPPPPSSPKATKQREIRRMKSIADAASLYCSIAIATVIILRAVREAYPLDIGDPSGLKAARQKQSGEPACDEIYVVGEGETLHSISDKCGDPFIVEQNPHIHDPDDVVPGFVIKISPISKNRKLLRVDRLTL